MNQMIGQSTEMNGAANPEQLGRLRYFAATSSTNLTDFYERWRYGLG